MVRAVSDDTTIALALPWHAVGLAPFLPGEDLRPCRDCHVTLVVGPSMAAALTADPSMLLCCPSCAVERCRERGTVTIASVTLV